ncbi:LysM peptidoglycan-binding domain-containing protein [Pseudobacteroides cellulosolvens]|uniref:Peptidoglycan-binding lysin domain-containing protein n=1 Tax=Pseudobacteroides cellulosolvens ATCC 35603 = DSM 2933 TaxID=398512 RepID=A0A0L6JTS2_9FIRM|nr:LysM peptidoglycan-binding domain-containing protein [Pseudobacteroides cellulosolvens]KNY28817.1 Peptidoglycan-binding lysin domain-containing protein [Pseudobacteroides cellulosolvens ATCC 35603 = DSM 2933]
MFEQHYRQCPANSVAYTVKAGDTLYSIARRYNTSFAAIMNTNPGINPNRLSIGQVICIPSGLQAPQCTAGYYYSIRHRDTLYEIADIIGLPLETLLRANPGINPYRLMIGQRICIPYVTGTLLLIKNIPVFVEGQTEYREARLYRSYQGYYIYILNNFTFTGEEPGRDLVFSNYDSGFDVRIEMLPLNADTNMIRTNSMLELQYVGTPVEMKGEEIFDPFFRNAVFFLHASSNTLSKNIILIRIGNYLFRFTVSIPNTEAAEGLGPSLYAMLKTIFV